MFRKKPQETAELVEKTGVVAEKGTSPAAESVQAAQGSRRCTVVAANTVFSGNTEIEGDIQVYGKMQGQIDLKDGILYVMRGGFIDGEFTAPSIIINGRVEGTCISENIEIHEHGEMEGISRSGSLSIRPGGSFIGQSERLATVKKQPEAERVVKIKKNQSEKPAEAAAGVSLAMSE
ncbi:MAG TPA: polymer-forming cytoskeletal protein [Buttiauxella sp.]